MTVENEIIERISEYIESKDANYLAKEGQIVYFASHTGRKADYMWHKLTVNEMSRIVKAMYLSSTEQISVFRESHLITAFQELGRVYEFGIKSRHTVGKHLFNYSQHAQQSLGDEVLSMLVEQLQIDGFTGVLLMDVLEVVDSLDTRIKMNLTVTEKRELVFKHFETAGFNIKTGAQRPLIGGKKQGAIMMPTCKPRDVMVLYPPIKTRLITKIYGEIL